MYSSAEIAEYYNTTQNHYLRWWRLGKQNSLHYGIRDNNARTFAASLENTNSIMMETAGIPENARILDAGCGTGGAAVYLSRMKNAEVVGISLSVRQIDYAKDNVAKNHPETRISFQVMDFTNTTFPDGSFDVIWACESVCQADKMKFISESYRLLKNGGKLILADFFITSENQEDRHSWIRKWCDTWAVSELISCETFTTLLARSGFINIQSSDYTGNIKQSARRMLFGAIIGAIPSETYNLFHPQVTRFAKQHYKCGYYQYRALKEGLWKYKIITARKEDADGITV